MTGRERIECGFERQNIRFFLCDSPSLKGAGDIWWILHEAIVWKIVKNVYKIIGWHLYALCATVRRIYFRKSFVVCFFFGYPEWIRFSECISMRNCPVEEILIHMKCHISSFEWAIRDYYIYMFMYGIDFIYVHM